MLSSEIRDRYLSSACEGERELRESVESLIQAFEESRNGGQSQ